MNKFRKKPIVIEAHQWHQNGDHPLDGKKTYLDDVEVERKCEGKLIRYFRNPDVFGRTICKKCGYTMHKHGWIDTLEGGHTVCVGDWVIKGIKGEFYPCKPDIFQETYEPVHE